MAFSVNQRVGQDAAMEPASEGGRNCSGTWTGGHRSSSRNGARLGRREEPGDLTDDVAVVDHAAMEPASEGGRNEGGQGDLSPAPGAAMEPASEGGRNWVVRPIVLRYRLPQWSPPRKAGGTRPLSPDWQVRSQRRNGARLGRREELAGAVASAGAHEAAMEPASEGGRNVQAGPGDLIGATDAAMEPAPEGGRNSPA